MLKVTFDRAATPFITKILGSLRGRNCHFCGTPLNQDNFAGAYKDKKTRMFCTSLPCLIQYSDLTRD